MRETIESYFKGDYWAFYGKYLTSVKKIGGDEYQAVCPFHEDTKPSFNFNNETGQFYCHGCNKKGHAFHFYAKLNGLDTRRDFPKILKSIASDFGIPWEETKPQIEKTYNYIDEAGNLLFQVVRMNPKDFRQRRPGDNGKWVWDLKDTRRVLYRLPQVIGAQEVLIVEGEKDADALFENFELIATTCPGGARKWSEDYNQFLQGKNIVLIPDNDNEGREHMTQVAISLNGQTRSLKWIDLPNLPSHGDFSDFLATFDDKTEAAERLSVMIENAGQYEPPKTAIHDDIVLEAKDFTALELPRKEVLLEPWLTEQSITLISGWRGTGKTWLALSILDAVSKGEPFGPWQGVASVPCLFLDGEMPAQDLQERIQGLNMKSIYVYSDAYANSFGLAKANLLSEIWRSTMKRILQARHVKLWVVDNLASLAGGIDENVKRDWDPVNQWLLDLRFAGIATILLHHTNKEGEQRGTSAREDNIDSSIILKRPFDYSAEEGCKFILHFTKARVRTQDLKLIPDMEFQLTQDEKGEFVWTYGNIKAGTKREILRFTDEGVKPSEIASAVGVTRQYVSKIQIAAKKEGLLGKDDKLSPTGFEFVSNLNLVDNLG